MKRSLHTAYSPKRTLAADPNFPLLENLTAFEVSTGVSVG